MNKINKQWDKFWDKATLWADHPGLTIEQRWARKSYLNALDGLMRISVFIVAMFGFAFVFIGTLHLIINYPDQLGIAILAGMPLFFLGWTVRVLLFKPQPISAGDEEVHEFEEPTPTIIWGVDRATLDSDPWAEDWSEWADYPMSEEERRSLLEE